jgi:hypothetical protein
MGTKREFIINCTDVKSNPMNIYCRKPGVNRHISGNTEW